MRHAALYRRIRRLHRRVRPRFFQRDPSAAQGFLRKAQAIDQKKFYILIADDRIKRSLGKRWDFRAPRRITDARLAAYHPDMPGYLKQLQSLPEFKQMVAQTHKRRDFCAKQWQRNYARSLRIMERLTGIVFRRCLTVYLTYPGDGGGRYLGRTGPADCPHAFLWGGVESFPNYTTIYFWHEILHGYFPWSKTAHALIQLIVDNELRVRLNKSTEPYPPYEGHLRLVPIMHRLLPAWRRFLAQKGRRDARAFLDLHGD